MSKSQKLISKNGISIDLGATAKEANKHVDRDEGVPIHACGARVTAIVLVGYVLEMSVRLVCFRNGLDKYHWMDRSIL